MKPAGAAIAAAAALALLVGALAWQSTALSGSGTSLGALLPWWLAFALLWVVLSYLPPREPCAGWTPIVVILGVAVAARVAVVFTAAPTLSDDLWRYVHDGHTLGVLGTNPYLTSPAERNPLELPINHPHLVTIYQPASQWVFAVLARLSPDERVFRLGFVLADVLIALVLIGALRREGQPVWLAALWAWHPLVVTEVAGSGHQDVLGILPLIGAVLLLERGQTRGAWPTMGGAALLAVAIAVKPVVAPLVLPAAWSLRRRPRALGLGLLSGAVVLAGLYVPFALMTGGLSGLWSTGRTFIQSWAYNGSVHPVLTHLAGDHAAASLVCGGLLLSLLIGWTLAGVALRRTAMYYLFAALLLSSTVHPWYVLWPLVLVPLVRGGAALAVWVFSAAVILAYTAHLSPRGHPFVPAVVAEYVLVYGVTAAAVLAAAIRTLSAGADRRKMLNGGG